MAAGFGIKVQGLSAFRSSLREMGKAFPKELQKENKALANRAADAARSAYAGMYTQRSGAGAGSIVARATQLSAAVSFGSDKAPYMLGQEFGANQTAALGGGLFGAGMESTGISIRRDRGRVRFIRIGSRRRVLTTSLRQFPPYIPSPSGRGGHGYFVYPTLRRMIPEMMRRYGEAIDRVAAKAFPKGGG